MTGRPSLAPTKRPVPAKTDPVSRRQTTTALNDKTNVRSGVNGQKTSLNKTSGAGASKKIPAWDVKGRLAAMESMMEASNSRIASLELEKTSLQTDVEVKKEVVQEASEEIKILRKNMERNWNQKKNQNMMPN